MDKILAFAINNHHFRYLRGSTFSQTQTVDYGLIPKTLNFFNLP
jgi:hypothetical protein